LLAAHFKDARIKWEIVIGQHVAPLLIVLNGGQGVSGSRIMRLAPHCERSEGWKSRAIGVRFDKRSNTLLQHKKKISPGRLDYQPVADAVVLSWPDRFGAPCGYGRAQISG